MDIQAGKKFSWRGFISVTTGLSFLAMSISGIVLFVTPFGRLAHWSGWTMLALTKDQWAALHIWFSLVFLIVAAFHIHFNWRPLSSYFKRKVRNAIALRMEWVLSVVVCGTVLAGTLVDVAPFSSLLIWNDTIKHSWEVPGQQAPVPHAELMTLAEIADTVKGIDVESMIANIRSNGIKVESADAILGELARANNLTPSQLYDISTGKNHLQAGAGSRTYSGRGYGMGYLTLQQYCSQAGLDVDTAIEKLRNKDIQAGPDMLLRDIAHAAGLHASDIRRILEE